MIKENFWFMVKHMKTHNKGLSWFTCFYEVLWNKIKLWEMKRTDCFFEQHVKRDEYFGGRK